MSNECHALRARAAVPRRRVCFDGRRQPDAAATVDARRTRASPVEGAAAESQAPFGVDRRCGAWQYARRRDNFAHIRIWRPSRLRLGCGFFFAAMLFSLRAGKPRRSVPPRAKRLCRVAEPRDRPGNGPYFPQGQADRLTASRRGWRRGVSARPPVQKSNRVESVRAPPESSRRRGPRRPLPPVSTSSRRPPRFPPTSPQVSGRRGQPKSGGRSTRPGRGPNSERKRGGSGAPTGKKTPVPFRGRPYGAGR